MASIFLEQKFVFPYNYRFPGQASDENILFVARENQVMVFIRLAVIIGFELVIILAGTMLLSSVSQMLGLVMPVILILLLWILAAGAGIFAWWWVRTLWQKSLFILTTRRLIKFIYTSPVNRHVLSLPLEMIVDTGAYTKGFIQAWLHLGTFTARSSASSSGVATDDADRVNKKYFYIENIAMAEDLQQYINKLLTAFRNYYDHLATFRPFIPELKGEAREEFMKNYPEYWS